MPGDIIIDETQCGPLCQHPTCWYSERRLIRGTPHTTRKDNTTNTDDESYYSLPTQTVLNLLDDYGEDPNDKYPSKYSGKPTHSRDTTSRARVARGESLPRVRAPNATPASPLRPVGSVPSATNSAIIEQKPVTQVEVQEVFDLDDLRSDWHDTFQAKKYYVWVPNDKKRKQKARLQSECGVAAEKSADPTTPMIKMKDVTTQLVPEQIEIERESSTIKKPRKQPMSLWKSFPYYYPDCHCETPKPKFRQPSGKYHGVYELLDLPKDVLSQIMQHITERELLDRRKFAEALVRVLPQLEKDSTAISLAYSDVLQQYPVVLNDKKAGEQVDRPGMRTKPIFQIDERIILDKLTGRYFENQSTQRSCVSDFSVKAYASGQNTGKNAPSSKQDFIKHVKKQPLPSIPARKGEPTCAPPSTAAQPTETLESTSPKKMPVPVPNISLGLPEIPCGARATKSFTYTRNQKKDFTLAAVVTPSSSGSAAIDAGSGADSPSSQPHAVSTVHVTVPTVTPERDEFKTPSQTERLRQETGEAVEIFGPPNESAAVAVTGEVKMQGKDTKLTVKIPRPPVNTPNISTQEPNTLTPEVCSTLDTVQEQRVNSPSGSQQLAAVAPMSRDTASRSVRFSVKTPEAVAMPESDADNNEGTMTPDQVKQLSYMSTPSTVGRTGTSNMDNGELVVIGQRRQPQPTPPSRPRSKHPQAGPAPAPWPHVEVEKVPSPVPSSNTGTTSVNIYEVGTDQSIAATYDGGSEHSGLTAMMPRSVAPSRESSAHSEQVKRMWHEGRLPQSPAPPPPSPEPTRDLITELASTGNFQSVPPPTPAAARENAHLVILKEVAETDSEITITAPPPSNLDDISRINTPNSIASAPQGLMSRENTNLSSIPRVGTVRELSAPKEPWSVGQKEQTEESRRPQEPTSVKSPGTKDTPAESGEATTEIYQQAASVEPEMDQLKIPTIACSGGAPPHIDTDQISVASANADDDSQLIQNGRVEYIQDSKCILADPVEEVNAQHGANSEPGNDNGDTEEHGHTGPGGAPPQIDEEQLEDIKEEINSAGGSAYKPLQPRVVDHEQQDLSETHGGGGNDDFLDRFDVTEEDLKDELKEELKKFKE